MCSGKFAGARVIDLSVNETRRADAGPSLLRRGYMSAANQSRDTVKTLQIAARYDMPNRALDEAILSRFAQLLRDHKREARDLDPASSAFVMVCAMRWLLFAALHVPDMLQHPALRDGLVYLLRAYLAKPCVGRRSGYFKDGRQTNQRSTGDPPGHGSVVMRTVSLGCSSRAFR